MNCPIMNANCRDDCVLMNHDGCDIALMLEELGIIAVNLAKIEKHLKPVVVNVAKKAKDEFEDVVAKSAKPKPRKKK